MHPAASGWRFARRKGAHFLLSSPSGETLMKNYKTLAAASFALILLAACGSSGIGDILGGGGSGSNNQSRYDIQGTVESIDLNSRAIYLTNVSGYNSSMLSNGGSGNGSVRVYYDERTPVSFNGQSYRPADLERGDQVTVRVDESGNNLLAESVTVVRDVSSGNSSSYPTYPSNGSSSYDQTIRGTVSYVDTANRTVELQSASWVSGFNSNSGSSGSGSTTGRTIIHYDVNTQIDVAGRMQSFAGLERGDVIEVRVTRDSNSSALWAQSAYLVRDINQR
jgi:hypothetical protein